MKCSKRRGVYRRLEKAMLVPRRENKENQCVVRVDGWLLSLVYLRKFYHFYENMFGGTYQ